MLTPAQEFEQLLDRYRVTEGLCAPDHCAQPDDPPAFPKAGDRPRDAGAARDLGHLPLRVFRVSWSGGPLG